jgi:hypothetical protein
LEVNGAEILFDAMKLDIRVQDELLVWQRARTISSSATEVELLARGSAGDLIAQTRVTVSYDGACRFRVSLIPQGIVTIDSILFDVPILRTETTHYAHHLLGADAPGLTWQELAGDPQAQWGGGRIPDNGWSGEITPYFWTGNPERGLVWFTDLVVGPQRQDSAAQVQLRPVEGAMRLLVDLITDPLDMPETVHLDFGIQPTPVRPIVPPQTPAKPVHVEWSGETSRLTAGILQRMPSDLRQALNTLRERGSTAIVLNMGWSDIWGFPYLGSDKNQQAFRDLVNLTHDAGLKIIPTISALQLSNQAPGAAEVLEDMPLPNQPIMTVPSSQEQIYPLFHTDATVSLFEEAVRAFATEYPIDGVVVHVGDPAVRPVDRNHPLPGATVALDLYARRDLMRRLYALFHGGLRENDEEGIVIASSPIPWSMMHSYADLVVTGLYLYQSIASRRLSGGGLADRLQPELVPFLYGDVLHRVPTLWHVPGEDLQFPSIIESYTRADLLGNRELFGLAAVHNTSLWPERQELAEPFADLARLEQLRTDLGFGNATWHPYWRYQERFLVQPASTLFGYWRGDADSILLVLLNGTNSEQDILIEMTSGANGGNGGLTIEEVWTGLPVRTRDNLIIITLAASQLAVLRIGTG